MKICPNCSNANNDTAGFCQQCGYQFNSAMNYSTVPQDSTPAYHQTEGSKFCSSCGAQIPFSSTVCPKCGVHIGSTSQNFGTERPIGVIILAILGIMGGLSIIASAALAAAFISGIGLIVAVIGIIFLFVSVSLFTGKNWSRILILIFSVIILIAIPVGTIIGIIFIIYFTRPHVVAYFKRVAY